MSPLYVVEKTIQSTENEDLLLDVSPYMGSDLHGALRQKKGIMAAPRKNKQTSPIRISKPSLDAIHEMQKSEKITVDEAIDRWRQLAQSDSLSDDARGTLAGIEIRRRLGRLVVDAEKNPYTGKLLDLLAGVLGLKRETLEDAATVLPRGMLL